MHPGKLSISRPRGSGPDYVSIALTDARNHSTIGEIRLDLTTFAEALFGMGYVDCTFDLDTSHVGLDYEYKQVEVFVPEGPYLKGRVQAALAVAAHEVDGWRGRVDDARNPHNVVRRVESGVYYRVHFGRYVQPKQEK